MLLFYTKNIENNRILLDKENSRHAAKVLRLNVGDELHLTNGNGDLVKAKVSFPDPKQCVVEVVQRQHFEARTPALTLVVAPTKNIARFEWMLEKATEIGVEHIIPIICERSERKVIKPERLEKVLIAAMKQSLKYWLPELSDPLPFMDFLKEPPQGQRFIGWMDEQGPPHLKNALQTEQNATILIGPEGDFSPKEVALAKAEGFEPISLGPSRLRTETAAIVACHTFALHSIA